MIDRDRLCDTEAEQAVLGAAMLDLTAADDCLAVLRPDMFASDRHRRAWVGVAALRARSSGVDPLSLGDELQRSGDLDAAGGPTYLADLQASLPATANATHYAGIVRDLYVRRQIVAAARKAQAAACDVESAIGEVAAAVDSGLRAAADAAAAPDGPVPLSELVVPAYQRIEAIHDRSLEPGIPTGIDLLDALIGGGLHRGELAIVGAPPSEGKSALAEAVAIHMAMHGRRVLYETPEMTRMQVALRALAYVGGIDLRRFSGRPGMEACDWPALSRAVGDLSERGRELHIEDRANTIEAISANARRMNSRGRLDLIVVDHLHELEWPKGAGNENNAIGEIVRQCKALAKALDCPVMLLSQLNRNARSEKREPELHDLRGSGAIEQHANLALLLQRKDEGESPPRKVTVLVKIAKNRDGVTGRIYLEHDRATGRFSDPKAPRKDGAA